MSNGPLRLTDDQLTAVLRAAEPLAIGDRGAFLQDVAAALKGQELGDGTVYRTIAQQETGEMGQGDQVRWHQAAVKLPQARYQGGLYNGA